MEAKNYIDYDTTELNKFFNEFESPEELKEEIIDLVFDYAASFNKDELEVFKKNIGILYVIYDQISKIRAK